MRAIEELTINVPDEFSSKMIDMVTRRKGELLSMNTEGNRVNIMFEIPSRGIMGLRTNVLTASQGEAIMAHRFKEYQPFKGRRLLVVQWIYDCDGEWYGIRLLY